jgi:membrane dipeptidase
MAYPFHSLRYLVDGHLDLAMNAMEWNRDLTEEITVLRAREQGMTDKPGRGNQLVCFPELRKARIGLCVATLIARCSESQFPVAGWYSQEQAWAQTRGQLAWYQAMEQKGEVRLIHSPEALHQHLKQWEHAVDSDCLPIGIILSLEGADAILDEEALYRQYRDGLRAIGLAHYGPGVYACGTDAEGGLTEKGRWLLQQMEKLGLILDTTHLCEQSFWQALDQFQGPVWASHQNCRALVPHHRQISDEQIRALLARDAVIGVAFDAWMLVPNWQRGQSTPEQTGVSLRHVVDQIDHICQLAGDSAHVAIGSDLDGGFGMEQCPLEMLSIADIWRLASLLQDRGYAEVDIAQMLSRNIVRFFLRAWGAPGEF